MIMMFSDWDQFAGIHCLFLTHFRVFPNFSQTCIIISYPFDLNFKENKKMYENLSSSGYIHQLALHSPLKINDPAKDLGWPNPPPPPPPEAAWQTSVLTLNKAYLC